MDHGQKAANRITWASVLISVGMAAPLFAAYRLLDSKIALAQAADSFTDSFTSLALLYSLRVGAAPADREHPRGHGRAEPIAALVAAVLAGVVAIEVIREAIDALTSASQPNMHIALAGLIGVKLVGKAVIAVLSGRQHARSRSPALRALQIDARNDVLVGLLSLVGFYAARYGWHGWDAWLALPVAAWIAASGILLAMENIRLLMGEAPDQERQDSIAALARSVDGVESVHDLTARYDGTQLDVTLHVVVDEELSLRAAHDIAESVERRLMQERDILHAMVHVDVEPDEAT
ncbi:MAG: cation diffusion facilitator family transporter [Myxococcales bacterium]|nr:cation diffusion facilitator family transporter [Myxococcales bacterium]